MLAAVPAEALAEAAAFDTLAEAADPPVTLAEAMEFDLVPETPAPVAAGVGPVSKFPACPFESVYAPVSRFPVVPSSALKSKVLMSL